MSPEGWQQVKSILDGALDLSPTRRAKFLAQSCGADAELRREVESLLEFEKQQTPLFENLAFDLITPDFAAENCFVGKIFGRYKIIKEIGAGGMGTVFLAERADGEFEQKVAVKIIKSLSSRENLRRFNLERQILASLQHPYISRLIDGGTTESGLPYLVMEYVEGDSIIKYAAGHNLNLAERLNLFRQVCAAVSYAHRHLIVHRDLKPSNILITEDGTPKLLDFGIAKIIKNNAAKETRTQSRAFTPEYSSPEQLRGENLTTATDIYSLGIVLYELLTESRPFQNSEENIGKLMNAVTNIEPLRPSSAVNCKFQNSENAEREKSSKSEIRNPKLLKGDLDNIVLKAIKREPERRYYSVEQFSEDVRRHLCGLPVLARPDAYIYRAGKFIRRNPLVCFALLIAFAALVVGVVSVGYQARIANAERAKSERRFNDVRNLANSFMFEINEEIDKSPIKARELLVERALEYLDKLSAESETDVSLQSELATAYEKIGNIQSELFKPSSGKTADALVSHRKSLQIREKLYAAEPQNVVFGLNVVKSRLLIGDIYSMSGKLGEARENYREAISLNEKLLWLEPENAEAKHNLFRAYARLGQAILRSGSLGETLENYKKASNINRSLLTENPKNEQFQRASSIIHSYIGYVYLETGDTDEAERNFKTALDIMRKISAADFASVQSRGEVAAARLWYGIALREQSKTEKSLREISEALETQKAIFDADAANFGEQNALADCYLEYGITLAKNGRINEALANYRKASENYKAVWDTDRENISAQSQIALTQRFLADALRQKGEAARALEVFRQTLEDFTKLTAADPNNTEWQYHTAVCYLKIGEILFTKGDKRQAAENFQKALPILENLTAQSPENAKRKGDLAIVKNYLAQLKD